MTLHSNHTVRLSKPVGRKNDTRQITVPADISRGLPDGAVFQVEVQTDGLFYRYCGIADEQPHGARKPVVALPFVNGDSA